jgi:predicted DNA-binding transcriptional regulator AlpA
MTTQRIFRTPHAARYVGLSAATLEKRRLTGDGPRFIRLGRAVGYDVRDLDAWLDQLRQATNDTNGDEPRSVA